ncbi:MAG: hypothetical protein ABS81_16070 [Pseudonocardia sp. SCN 72-86]|nr:MAG: hypothetical protein ABS81_16070 [Pseudonocardia sp. SCN 72-86]
MSADPTVVVPALLSAAGPEPSAEEVAVMVAEYPGRAEQIEALRAVEAARYEEPCVIFRVEP